MRSAIRKIEQTSVVLAMSAAALWGLAATATAQGISTQTNSAGLSIYSHAEPTFFSPARNAGCEAEPRIETCDSFTVTIRNEGNLPTGVVKAGEEQTCEPGEWDTTNPPSEFKYEWLRDEETFGNPEIVSGEAQGYPSSYTPTNSDKEFTLSCRVIATNTFGTTVAYSQPLWVAPVPSVHVGEIGDGVSRGVFSTLREEGSGFQSPSVFPIGGNNPSSTAEVGEGLVCDPGKWSSIGNSFNGLFRLRYRWLVDGKPVTGGFVEGVTSFKVPVEAEGKAIQCEVSTAAFVGAEPRGFSYAASQNRVVVQPGPVGGEPPLLAGSSPGSGGVLTLTNTPAISGFKLIAKDTLPAGVTAVGIGARHFRSVVEADVSTVGNDPIPCELATLTCTVKVPLAPGNGIWIEVLVTTQQSEGEVGANLAEVFDGKETPALLRSSAQEPEGKSLTSPIGEGDPPFEVRAASLQVFGTAGQPDIQAGDRPSVVTSGIQFPTVGKGLLNTGGKGSNVPPASANVRDVRVTLPPGLVGNPLATLRCVESKIETIACPATAQVGAFKFDQSAGGIIGDQRLPIFNTIPAEGYPAEFGGIHLERFIGIFANLVRAPAEQGGYTVQVTAPGVPLITPITNTLTTFFGDPTARVSETVNGPALLTNPSDCGTSPTATIEADTWQEIGNYRSRNVPLLPAGKTIENCSLLSFGPTIEMEPDTSLADTPTGMSFELNVPQAPDIAPSLGTPPLKDATVTLPVGLSASPAQADRLGACSEEQLDIAGEAINGFGHDDGQPHPTPGECPVSSKIATAKVTTPLLAEPVEGSVYLGEPDCSPCTDADAASGKMINLYIEARDRRYGVVVKLAGKVTANPATGQLQATFLNGPQFPFSQVELDFKGGPRAALSTPLTCGTYAATSEFVPWSAPETPSATPADDFGITSGPGGSPCLASEAEAPNAPSFEAGVLNPLAASYSPFVLRLNRADGTQRIKGLNLTLPPGLTGKLAGVPPCPDATLAAADSNGGKAEQASPSCPAASQVGTVDVGAGSGPQPLHVQGRVYVAGPYKGAPLSMAIVTPAVAGPFDLGTVVVRTALYVNPTTAQITAKSDALPTILGGVPLNMRSATVTIDRDAFTLNPTSCEAMQVMGEAIAISGEVAQLSNRFQVGGCKGLDFKPKLGMRLIGGTKRGAHPKLRAVLTAKPGEANIAKASVALPRSEFLDQAHIRTVCTRVQFAADNCPKGAIYGHVRAFTPLLDEPLEGPVYLRSSDNELPDAVGVLKGPPSRPIQIETAARIDSIKGGIRANFESVPDAPVTKVIVTMQGGKKGLLINSANLCKIKLSARRATVRMRGHNGKVHNFRPVVKNKCRR